ncbi:hypothetical protein SALBM311S_01705 [Streptomyces alboniger]
MRRTVSPLSLILLGLGTFLLVLAPLLAWYVEPRAAVNPLDIDTTAVYEGTGSVFDTEDLKTVPDRGSPSRSAPCALRAPYSPSPCC